MTGLILLVALTLTLIFTTLRLMIHDGPTTCRPPQSHFQDPRFLAASRLWR